MDALYDTLAPFSLALHASRCTASNRAFGIGAPSLPDLIRKLVSPQTQPGRTVSFYLI